MKRIVHKKSGAIEYIDDDTEKASKSNLRGIKSASDLSSEDVTELVFKLAKKNNLI